jgi:hypothetical protein
MRLAKIKQVFDPIAEKNRVLSEMEVVYNEFINSIGSFVENWYRTQYNRYIDLLAVQYESLTEEQKYKLEDIVDEMIAANKPVAVDYFININFWWHKNENLDLKFDFYKSIDNLIDDEFRALLGDIGKALNSFDFIPKFYDTPLLGFLCFKNEKNIYKFKFVDPIFWSREMKTSMDNYWEKYKYIISLGQNQETKKSA